MNDYEAKRQARIDRLRAAAERKEAESAAAYKRSTDMASVIPMGQPIMVGHHSEKADRRYREKIWNTMGKSVALSKEAADLEARADAAEANTAISSDDPEAVVKMREKLANAEAYHERMKATNAAHKKFLKDPASLDKADLPDEVKLRIRHYKPAYSWEPHPHAPFELTNSNANIRRMKQRLEELQRVAKRAQEADEKGVPEPVKVGEVTIEQHPEENRVWLVFPGKPAKSVIEKVKSMGFRWSPTDKAWKRHLSNSGVYAAEYLAKQLAAGVP